MCKFLNIRNIGKYFALLILITLIIAQGCEDKDKIDPVDAQNRIINDWILDIMEEVYFWNTLIPPNANKSLKPDVFFNSLLKRPEDRFSVIYDNFQELLASLMGVNREAGYDFNLGYLDEYEFNIIGYITYIKPGTPAEAAGIKRGDFFLRINNTQMNINNYGELLQATANPHSLGILEATGIRNVQLNVIEYAENPILLDTIYTHFPDKKIGYFVYNFFARDRHTDGIAYEKELNNLFGKFKNETIDELIIDLRYNSGGTTITAQALASMISGLPSSEIFGIEIFNDFVHSYYSARIGANYNKMFFLNNIERINEDDVVLESVPINKLSNLKNLYLITSRQTASASELIINGLRPYMDNVILVGDTTAGKNFGSWLIYETNPVKQRTNNWGMLPIVFKLENNANFSDYGDGFEPAVRLHETMAPEIKPLGNTDELLLAATLDLIFGNSTAEQKNVGDKTKIIGSAIDRTPARKNMYVYDRKNSLFRRD